MQDGDDNPIAAKSSADKLAAGSSLLIDPTVSKAFCVCRQENDASAAAGGPKWQRERKFWERQVSDSAEFVSKGQRIEESIVVHVLYTSIDIIRFWPYTTKSDQLHHDDFPEIFLTVNPSLRHELLD